MAATRLADAGARPDRDVAGAGVLAGLLVGTFTRLSSRPLGLESRRVVVADLGLLPDAVAPEERSALFERLRSVVGQVPGVDTDSLSTKVPVSGSGWNSSVIDVDGTDVGGDGRQRMVWASGVSDGFFATYGIAMRAGRDFVDRGHGGCAPRDDRERDVRAALPRNGLQSADASGRAHSGGRTLLGYREIVGVVADTVYRRDLRRDFEPTVFMPLGQLDGPPREPSRRRALAPVTPPHWSPGSPGPSTPRTRASSPRVRSSGFVHNALTQERLIATVAGLFGGLALVLAIVGLLWRDGVHGEPTPGGDRRAARAGRHAGPCRHLVLRRVHCSSPLASSSGVGLSLGEGRRPRPAPRSRAQRSCDPRSAPPPCCCLPGVWPVSSQPGRRPGPTPHPPSGSSRPVRHSHAAAGPKWVGGRADRPLYSRPAFQLEGS